MLIQYEEGDAGNSVVGMQREHQDGGRCDAWVQDEERGTERRIRVRERACRFVSRGREKSSE